VNFVEIIGRPELKDDPRFRTNADRVKNNAELIAIIEEELVKKPKAYWLAELEKAKIPCGPMLNYDEVFTDPHVLAREMYVTTKHAKAGRFDTIGVPVKMSETPGSVRRAAPARGGLGQPAECAQQVTVLRSTMIAGASTVEIATNAVLSLADYRGRFGGCPICLDRARLRCRLQSVTGNQLCARRVANARHSPRCHRAACTRA
jgi:hypothetical protein